MKQKKLIAATAVGVACAIACSLLSAAELSFQANSTLIVPNGILKYENTEDGLKLQYRSSQGEFSYNVKKYDECSMMGVYKIDSKRQFEISGSCPSQGGQIYEYVYEWNQSIAKWCLVRDISGEKSDRTAGEVVPDAHVARVDGCIEPGSNAQLQYKSKEETKNDILNKMKEFEKIKSNDVEIQNFINALAMYDIYELADNVDSKTVEDINDIAYFLSENKRSYDAVILLQRITREFPDRAVAKLNLADAYWDNHFYEQAIPMYKNYQASMLRLGLGKKIPRRVVVRMSQGLQ